MIRKFLGNKKSLEATLDDNGQTWTVELFENGSMVRYLDATAKEVEELAAKHGMRPA
jgi:IS4 transposase